MDLLAINKHILSICQVMCMKTKMHGITYRRTLQYGKALFFVDVSAKYVYMSYGKATYFL